MLSDLQCLEPTCLHGRISPRRLLARVKELPAVLKRSRYLTVLARRFRRQPEVLHIDPCEAVGYLNAALSKRMRARAVRGEAWLVDGEWDLEVERYDFTATPVYESCRMHWLEGVAWEETPVFRDYVDRIDRGVMKRFATHQDLLDRYRSLDAIYEQARERRGMSPLVEHMIFVNFDRHGQLIVGPDGRHRHAIALILGFDRVPMRVLYVHPAALDRFRALRTASAVVWQRASRT